MGIASPAAPKGQPVVEDARGESQPEWGSIAAQWENRERDRDIYWAVKSKKRCPHPMVVFCSEKGYQYALLRELIKEVREKMKEPANL